MPLFLKRIGARGREYFGANVSAFSGEKKFSLPGEQMPFIGDSAFFYLPEPVKSPLQGTSLTLSKKTVDPGVLLVKYMLANPL